MRLARAAERLIEVEGEHALDLLRQTTLRTDLAGAALRTASTMRGQTGVGWDNAAAESCWSTLMTELYNRRHWPNQGRSATTEKAA